MGSRYCTFTEITPAVRAAVAILMLRLVRSAVVMTGATALSRASCHPALIWASVMAAAFKSSAASTPKRTVAAPPDVTAVVAYAVLAYTTEPLGIGYFSSRSIVLMAPPSTEKLYSTV